MTHIVLPRDDAELLRLAAKLDPDDDGVRAQTLRQAAARIRAQQVEDADADDDSM